LLPLGIFTIQSGGGLLAWMSDEASIEELETVQGVLKGMVEFSRKQHAAEKTCSGRLKLWNDISYYDKAAAKNNSAWRERAAQWKQRRMQEAAAAKSSDQVGVSIRGAAGDQLSSQGPVEGLEDVNGLLKQVVGHLACDFGILIPSSNLLKQSLHTFGGNATQKTKRGLGEADSSLEAGTPAGLAHSQNTTVYVSNIRNDPRFTLSLVSPNSYTQVCKPISVGGDGKVDVILKLVNRRSTGASKPQSFETAACQQIIELYSELIARTLKANDNANDKVVSVSPSTIEMTPSVNAVSSST